MQLYCPQNLTKLFQTGETRTVARKSSIGGALRLFRGLDILKFDKDS